MLLKNLQLSNYSLGYAKYRTILTTFQTEALTPLFMNTKLILIEYMKQAFQNNLTSVDSGDLELSLEVMNHILNYPFVICYLEFTSESGGDNTSITMFPETWRSYFIDIEYFMGFISLLKIKDLSSEIKLLVVKNLSKISSCKKTLVPTEFDLNNQYLHFLMELPGRIVELINLEDSFFLEELVDLVERSINVYGLSKIMEQTDKVEPWVQALLVITKFVFMKNYRLNEKVFNSVSNVWKAIAVQNMSPLYERVMKEYLGIYYSVLFEQNNTLNIFSEVSYSQYERLKDLVEERYKFFVIIYPKHKELSLQFLFSLSKQVFGDFESLAARVAQGSINDKHIQTLLSKFLNFMLIISNSVLAENCYMYSKSKTPQKVEGLSPEELEGMVLASALKCISMLDSFNPFLEVGFRRHMEITVVCFFESFYKKVSREVIFREKDSNGLSVNLLDCKHNLFLFCLKSQSIFDSFESYVILTVNKCLGNLAIGDKIISRYSIFYLKLIVEELKKHLQLADFNQVSIPTHISKELLNINSTNLTDPQFYKLRSDLYEIISICFLEEMREDYIDNIHTILQRVLDLDLKADTDHNVGSVAKLSEFRHHALTRCDWPHPSAKVWWSVLSVSEDSLLTYPGYH